MPKFKVAMRKKGYGANVTPGIPVQVWDENQRTITGTETLDPAIDLISSISGNSVELSGSPTNVSLFTPGSAVLIITVYDTTTGTYQDSVGLNEIAFVATNDGSGTITLQDNVVNTYDTTNCQTYIVRANTIRSLNVPAGNVLECSPWGGPETMLAGINFICAETITVDGTISATAKGFRGGNRGINVQHGFRGESYYAGIHNVNTKEQMAGAGGGGRYASGSAGDLGSGGGGGGHGTDGEDSAYSSNFPTAQGLGGVAYGDPTLAKMYFGAGGGGGAGDKDTSNGYGGFGGAGGGILLIYAQSITVGATGTIEAKGEPGGFAYDPGNGEPGNGGSGAGGTILISSSSDSKVCFITNNGSITSEGAPKTTGGGGMTPGGGGNGITKINAAVDGNSPV